MIFQKKTDLASNLHPKAWRLLGYALTLVIIYFSINPSYPFKQSIAHIPFSDPMIHLFSFGLLMYCFYQSWEHKNFQLILAFGLVILGIILEIQQASITGTNFEFEDCLANTIGVVIGYLLSNLRKYQSRKIFSLKE